MGSSSHRYYNNVDYNELWQGPQSGPGGAQPCSAALLDDKLWLAAGGALYYGSEAVTQPAKPLLFVTQSAGALSAVELINDWRFDHHIGARSRLTTLLVSGEPAPAEAAVPPVDSTPATGTVPAEAAPASDTPAAEPAPAARKRKRS